MKRILNAVLLGALLSIGMEFGRKVWNEFIVGKIDSLKARFAKKD